MLLFRGYVAACFIILSTLCGITSSYAASGGNIFNGNRSFEKLASSGLIDSHIMGTRPIARKEITRLLIGAQNRLDEMIADSTTPPSWIVRIMEDMQRDVPQLQVQDAPYLKLPERLNINFLNLSGEKSSIPGIKAAQHGLLYNNEGIEPEEGFNTYFSFDLEGGAGPLSLYLNPLFSIENGEAEGTLHKGNITLSLKGHDLEVGKISLGWGQAYHGGLFLTNNAEPLKMVRLTNPSPVLLPWVLKYLGLFRFDGFVSRLEKDRDVPEPYFAGLRFNFKPHPALELGVTRTFIMGGDGRPGLTPARLGEIMFGENKVGDEELSNSIAGIDVRLTLPLIQLYGELGGEDEAGGLPYRAAYIVGFYLPSVGRGPDIRVEYADLTDKSWYRHGTYSSGYTYKGRILGHHVGGGGRDYFVEMGVVQRDRLDGRLNFDYEQRGVTTQLVEELHYQVGTEWRYRLGKAMADWLVEIGIAYERVNNSGYNAGLDKNNSLVSIGIRGTL